MLPIQGNLYVHTQTYFNLEAGSMICIFMAYNSWYVQAGSLSLSQELKAVYILREYVKL